MKQKIKLTEPVYKWQELSNDLQNYLLLRVIITVIVALCGIGVIFLVDISSVIKLYYAIVVLYIFWLGYVYIKAIYDKIYVYEGICEKKHLKVTNFNGILRRQHTWLKIYGKCDAVMVIGRVNEEGEYEEAKFIVPIGYEYDIEETNTLRVYTFENSVFRKNDNTYIITNPLMVKVSKK